MKSCNEQHPIIHHQSTVQCPLCLALDERDAANEDLARAQAELRAGLGEIEELEPRG